MKASSGALLFVDKPTKIQDDPVPAVHAGQFIRTVRRFPEVWTLEFGQVGFGDEPLFVEVGLLGAKGLSFIANEEYVGYADLPRLVPPGEIVTGAGQVTESLRRQLDSIWRGLGQPRFLWSIPRKVGGYEAPVTFRPVENPPAE
jgi:hypothetical protein